MTRRRVKYYFSFASPFAAFADSRIDAIAAEFGAELAPDPIAFPSAPPPKSARLVEAQEFKISYQREDGARWAAKLGYRFNPPPASQKQEWMGQGFVDATRAAAGWYFANEHGVERAYRNRVFLACWSEARDIADPSVLAACAADAGLPGAAFLRALEDPAYLDRVPAVFQRCVADRVFGVPTFVVDGKRFWGNDRIDFLIDELKVG